MLVLWTPNHQLGHIVNTEAIHIGTQQWQVVGKLGSWHVDDSRRREATTMLISISTIDTGGGARYWAHDRNMKDIELSSMEFGMSNARTLARNSQLYKHSHFFSHLDRSLPAQIM